MRNTSASNTGRRVANIERHDTGADRLFGRPPIEALEDRRLLSADTGLAIGAAGVPVAPLAVPVAASYDGTVKYKKQAGQPAMTAQAFAVAIDSAAADGTIHGTLTSPTLGTVPFDGQLSGKKFVVVFDGAVDGYLTGKLTGGGKTVQATLLNVTEGTKAKVKARADGSAGFVLVPSPVSGSGANSVASVVSSGGTQSAGGTTNGGVSGGLTTGGTASGAGTSTTGRVTSGTTGGLTTTVGTTGRVETLTPGAAATTARDYLAALAAANGGQLPGTSTGNGSTGSVGSNGSTVGSNGSTGATVGAGTDGIGTVGSNPGTDTIGGTLDGGTVGSGVLTPGTGSVGTGGSAAGGTVGTGSVGTGVSGAGGITGTGSAGTVGGTTTDGTSGTSGTNGATSGPVANKADATVSSSDIPPTIIVLGDGIF